MTIINVNSYLNLMALPQEILIKFVELEGMVVNLRAVNRIFFNLTEYYYAQQLKMCQSNGYLERFVRIVQKGHSHLNNLKKMEHLALTLLHQMTYWQKTTFFIKTLGSQYVFKRWLMESLFLNSSRLCPIELLEYKKIKKAQKFLKSDALAPFRCLR